MNKKIRAILIIESMGRPAQYLKESLIGHIGKMKQTKDVEVLSEKIFEPKKMEDMKEEMYTCFAEVEIRTISFSKMIELVFEYMPASVEISEPEKLEFTTADSNAIINELTGRLHRYDEITKVAQMQTQQLSNRLKVVHELLKDNNIDISKLLEDFKKKHKIEGKEEVKNIEEDKKEIKEEKKSKKTKKKK